MATTDRIQKKRKATEPLDTQAATAASDATMVSPHTKRALTYKNATEQEKKVEDSTSGSVNHSVCDLTGPEEQEEAKEDSTSVTDPKEHDEKGDSPPAWDAKSV